MRQPVLWTTIFLIVLCAGASVGCSSGAQTAKTLVRRWSKWWRSAEDVPIYSEWIGTLDGS